MGRREISTSLSSPLHPATPAQVVEILGPYQSAGEG